MNSSFLNTFLLTIDSGSMSEAARRLDVTPAAVAQQIRALEKELDTPLLTRSGRTVQPTEAGGLLAINARPLVKGINNLKSLVNVEAANSELRLGAINTALLSLIPSLLISLNKKYPNAKVFIEPGLSNKLYDQVFNGELDAAVCLHPSFVLSKSLMWKTLREESLVLLVPKKLAKIHPNEILKQSDFIRYDRSLAGGKQADQYLKKAGISPKEKYELSSILSIAMMVEAGLGVSIVPDIASPLLLNLNIAKTDLPLRTLSREIGILSKRSSPKKRLIEGLYPST